MYGKHFESMYEGSMYGAGVAVFAVWGYVIAHARQSRVELNPRKMSDTLGGTVPEVSAAIEYLMQPDPDSRHKQYEGRRLIKEGEYQYFIPSWDHYQRIRNEDARREYNRDKQREYRAKVKKPKRSASNGSPAGESAFLRAESSGASPAQCDAIVTDSLHPAFQ